MRNTSRNTGSSLTRLKKSKRPPHFKSLHEEAAFWDSHDFADYWDATEEVKLEVARKLIEKVRAKTRKRLISLRLAEWQLERAKKIAVKKHVPYQALLRQWITQGLRNEVG